MSRTTDSARRTGFASFGSNRVLGLSDAVIAIILTLMAVELLQLKVSEGEETLAARLLAEWPAYLAYTVSFFIIAQIWVSHRAMWSVIERADEVTILLNLVLLFFTSAIPFATKVLAETIGHANEMGGASAEVLAAGLYAAFIIGEALAFLSTWHWARTHGQLVDDLSDEQVQTTSRRFLLGPLLYLGAFALSFVGLLWSLAAFFALTLFYLRPGGGDTPRSTGHGG